MGASQEIDGDKADRDRCHLSTLILSLKRERQRRAETGREREGETGREGGGQREMQRGGANDCERRCKRVEEL